VRIVWIVFVGFVAGLVATDSSFVERTDRLRNDHNGYGKLPLL
jgi:hypothetical protein